MSESGLGTAMATGGSRGMPWGLDAGGKFGDMPTGGADDAAGGLCRRCYWARVVTGGKGSRFLRCGRSDDDPRYARYPALPMRTCAGFEEAARGGEAAGEKAGSPRARRVARRPTIQPRGRPKYRITAPAIAWSRSCLRRNARRCCYASSRG